MKHIAEAMVVKNIFDSWGSIYTVGLAELFRTDAQVWRQRLIDRKLLVIRGLGPNLPDERFHAIGGLFGRIWDKEDYKKTPSDTTIRNKDTTPVSYFQTNNMWGAREMQYHADMAHVDENSFPGRALYMIKSAQNGSGDTEWLNLELAWEQLTEEEQNQFNGVEVVQQYMYEPGTRLKKFPFLKTSPLSGKSSPMVNCYVTPGRNRTAWVHHIEKDGVPVDNTGEFIESVYRLCESKTDTRYKHHWINGDIVVYDNWFSVHRRDPITLEENESDRLLKRLTFNI